MAGRPSKYLKCRNSHLNKFITQLNDSSQADITLSDLLADMQQHDPAVYLEHMMKSVVFVDIDRTQRNRFYILANKGPLSTTSKERILALMKEKDSFPLEEHELIETIVNSIGTSGNVMVIEFLGYKKPGDGSIAVPVTLAACLYTYTKKSGAFIYYISGNCICCFGIW
jgi:hypothetical protein